MLLDPQMTKSEGDLVDARDAGDFGAQRYYVLNQAMRLHPGKPEELEQLLAIFRLFDLNKPEDAESIKQFILENKALQDQYKEFHRIHQSKFLTSEEIEFVEQLKGSGKLAKIQASYEVSNMSLHPKQIRDATRDMDQYTDEILKSAEALRTHMARNLAALQSGNSWIEDAAKTKDAKVRAMQEKESSLEAQVEQLDAEIKGRAAILKDHLREHSSDMPVPKDCQSDIMTAVFPGTILYDRLLDKLQALGWELKDDDQVNQRIIQAARHYANEEVFMLVQACRAQLNFAFGQACATYFNGAPQINDYKHADQTEMLAIVEEIQSLWDEVVPVAHMAVEKQLLGPILRRMAIKQDEADIHRAVISAYITGCLRFMNERLEALASCLSIVIYHHKSILVTYDQFVAGDPKKTRGSRKTYETVIDFEGPKFTHALKLIDDSMRRFGFSPIIIDDPSGPLECRLSKLNEFVQKRAAKGDDSALQVHKFFESAVKAQLHDSEISNRMIMNCIEADGFMQHDRRAAALQDPTTEESMEVMWEELQQIVRMVTKLKLPGFMQVLPSNELEITTPHILWPMLQRSLQFLENERERFCYMFTLEHETDSDKKEFSCLRCIEAMKIVDMVRKWADLPEFKTKPLKISLK